MKDQKIVLNAYVYEYDDGKSDYGGCTFTVPYDEIMKGNTLTYSKDIIVTENGGRYKGNTAKIKFIMTVTPK